MIQHICTSGMHKPRNGTQGGLIFLSLSLYLLKLFSLDEITFISSKIFNFFDGTAPCNGCGVK